MNHYLLNQLVFVRNNTLDAVEGISEEMANFIPAGFRNNIRWHLGHIYFVLEGFAFYSHDLPTKLPDGFPKYFANGTSPEDWDENTSSLEEIVTLLRDQLPRVKDALSERLHEPSSKPFKHASGKIKLETVSEFLSFNLFHEGAHFYAIKNYKKMYEATK